MVTAVELFPGFRLPTRDHAPLVDAIRRLELAGPALRIAHSFGS